MLFSYNNLEIKISSQTKTLFVYFKNAHLDLETLFELESLTQWLQTHIEVQSLVLTTEQEVFPLAPDTETLGRWSNENLRKFQQKLARLIWSLHKIPQTVIADMKRGTNSFGIELALAADLIFIGQDGEWDFDYLRRGVVPMSGAITLLNSFIGSAKARQWMLMGKSVSANELESAGLALIAQDPDEIVQTLQRIKDQSQVCRIQMKRQWLEMLTPEFEKIEDIEYPFALAAHDVLDFQRPSAKEDFVSARDIAGKMRDKFKETII